MFQPAISRSPKKFASFFENHYVPLLLFLFPALTLALENIIKVCSNKVELPTPPFTACSRFARPIVPMFPPAQETQRQSVFEWNRSNTGGSHATFSSHIIGSKQHEQHKRGNSVQLDLLNRVRVVDVRRTTDIAGKKAYHRSVRKKTVLDNYIISPNDPVE